MIKHLFFYVLSAAIKDKIFILYIGLVAIILSLSLFFGSSAVTEQDQFSAVFTSGALRIASAFTLVLFIVFYFRRSFLFDLFLQLSNRHEHATASAEAETKVPINVS